MLHLEALAAIEEGKGRTYAEVFTTWHLASGRSGDELRSMVDASLDGLANQFAIHHCSDEAVRRVVERCIERESKPSRFTPLPSEGELVAVIKEVNSAMCYEDQQYRPDRAPFERATEEDWAMFRAAMAAKGLY